MAEVVSINNQGDEDQDLIDKFNDTSRYLDEIFTIDNTEFAEHIPDTLYISKRTSVE